MAPKYNKELYRDDVYQWQEGDLTATRTTAWGGPGCHNGCQVIYYTDMNGRLVNVAVSYTHLDVYKRQYDRCTRPSASH